MKVLIASEETRRFGSAIPGMNLKLGADGSDFLPCLFQGPNPLSLSKTRTLRLIIHHPDHTDEAIVTCWIAFLQCTLGIEPPFRWLSIFCFDDLRCDRAAQRVIDNLKALIRLLC